MTAPMKHQMGQQERHQAGAEGPVRVHEEQHVADQAQHQPREEEQPRDRPVGVQQPGQRTEQHHVGGLGHLLHAATVGRHGEPVGDGGHGGRRSSTHAYMFTALNCDRREDSRRARRAYPRQMEVSHHTVTDADTAQRLGSGDLPVLATPRLINWIERAAYGTAAEGLEPGQTTVGTMVKVEHIKAAPVGTTVHVKRLAPGQRRAPPDLPRPRPRRHRRGGRDRRGPARGDRPRALHAPVRLRAGRVTAPGHQGRPGLLTGTSSGMRVGAGYRLVPWATEPCSWRWKMM